MGSNPSESIGLKNCDSIVKSSTSLKLNDEQAWLHLR